MNSLQEIQSVHYNFNSACGTETLPYNNIFPTQYTSESHSVYNNSEYDGNTNMLPYSLRNRKVILVFTDISNEARKKDIRKGTKLVVLFGATTAFDYIIESDGSFSEDGEESVWQREEGQKSSGTIILHPNNTQAWELFLIANNKMSGHFQSHLGVGTFVIY